MKINLVGVQHYDRRESLKSRLEEVSEDSDAIFLERPDSETTWRDLTVGFLVNPAMISFLVIYRYIGILATLLKNRERCAADEYAVDKVSEELNIPSFDVDKDIFRIVRENKSWIFLSWFFFSIAVYSLMEEISINSIGLDIIPIILLMWSFLGFFVAFPMLISTVPERNAYMLLNVMNISESKDFEEVTLVVGDSHIDNLEELCQTRGINFESSSLLLFHRLKNKITIKIREVFTWKTP